MFQCFSQEQFRPWNIGVVRSDQISRSVMSDSLQPHESQHARPPCPSPTPGVHSDLSPNLRYKVCVCVCVCVYLLHACMRIHFSFVWLFVTPWTVALQAPLSMEFSRQEYWSSYSLLQGNLPDPGIKPTSPAFAGGFFTCWATWEAPVYLLCGSKTWDSRTVSCLAIKHTITIRLFSIAVKWVYILPCVDLTTSSPALRVNFFFSLPAS